MTDRLKSNHYVNYTTNVGTANATLHITNLSAEDDGAIKCYGRNEAFLASSIVTLSMNGGLIVCYYSVTCIEPHGHCGGTWYHDQDAVISVGL